MGSERPTIIVASHDASETGAVIVLLRFLHWLCQEVSIDCRVVLFEGGPLVDEFREIGPTIVLGGFWSRVLRRIEPRSLDALLVRKFLRTRIRRHAKGLRNPVVWANTVRSGLVFEALEGRTQRSVSHLHELDYSFETDVQPAAVDSLMRRADHFVACSGAVRSMLIERLKVAEQHVSVVYEVADRPKRSDPSVAETLRRSMGADADQVLVGASGSMIWRKGPDWFLEVARDVVAVAGDQYRFVWIGGRSEGLEAIQFRHDRRALGLDDFVVHVPHVSTPGDLFGVLDLFVMTSREDPFPLVALEAGVRGVPVLSFAGGGGTPELTDKAPGLTVPYGSTSSMARRVLELGSDEAKRHALGRDLAARVVGQFTVERQGPALLEALGLEGSADQ